jgi:hypothetical protein
MAGQEVAGGQRISLLPGERVVTRLVANHIHNGRGYERYLYVTSRRLVHVPWAASETRGARPFGIALAEVTRVDAAPRGTKWRDGSLRRRLRVTGASGEAELFVVWRVGKAIQLIERARGEAGLPR